MELWLIIAAVALVGFGIFQCYRFILTIKAKRLKKSFVAFIDEVDAMRDPNSPLSSSQVDKVTTQYKPVFDKALPLFDSGVLSDDVKADTKLTPFIDTYRGLHHLPIWNQRNNSFFVTIFNLLDTSKIDYQNLFRDNHYFAGSEMDAYIEKYAPLKIAIESSQSENSFHYLTSSVQTDCKQFLFNLKSLAAERDKHNANFKKDQLALNSSYFDSVLAYPLDAQQRDAIVTLEDNTQVISAAGGGKTTTIVGKIKYLIEKRNYDPASILLITYTESNKDQRTIYIINHIISPMYQRYCDALSANNEIDFTDAIIQATELCKCNPGLASYDYILVDEFQDISKDRYEFLKSLRHQSPLTKLFCVGDDWQSIFRFSGSDMALFYDFAKFFGHTAECRIETTYRFGNPLIAKSSEFILKNENQKQKTVKSVSRDKRTFIHVHQYDNDELQARQVASLVANVPTDQSILILGRYGFSHNSLIFNSQGLISCSSNGADRVALKIGGRDCEFMTVHKAKGLEADVVILINCSSDIYGFPSNISDDPILNYLLSASDTFEFAEERRLFYVAITRARKHIHVLFDRKSPSIFIGEFQNIPEADICPQCGIGQRVIQKQGVAKNGHPFITYVCSNNDGCDYLETVFDNKVVIPQN